MQEFIVSLINQYARWGILLLILAAAFFLWRIYAQLKKLNRRVAVIGERVQEYLESVMAEEQPEKPVAVPPRNTRRSEELSAGGQRGIPMEKKREQAPEDEEVLNAVIQEFFS